MYNYLILKSWLDDFPESINKMGWIGRRGRVQIKRAIYRRTRTKHSSVK
jgi:hypothetical protein